MLKLLFVLLIQFPPLCPCIQVAAGEELTPFEHESVWLLATVPEQEPNEGIYTVEDVFLYPEGIAVVLLDRVPPVSDPAGGYFYGVVPIGPKRPFFRDGFESGDLSGWSGATE